MAESNKTILTLGALIIAGVALFFIGSYVGNAFYSPKSALTTAQKTEVLNMLKNCNFVEVSYNSSLKLNMTSITGNEMCNKLATGTICISASANNINGIVSCYKSLPIPAPEEKIVAVCCSNNEIKTTK